MFPIALQGQSYIPTVSDQAPRDFCLTFARDRRSVVVGVNGELDCSTAEILSQRLEDLVEDQGNLSIVLDLAGMTFVDSTGLSVFVTAFRHLRSRGGNLTLRRPSASARRVFEITGLHKVLPVQDL